MSFHLYFVFIHETKNEKTRNGNLLSENPKKIKFSIKIAI